MTDFHWFIDEYYFFKGYLYIRGWAFHQHYEITRLDCSSSYQTYENLPHDLNSDDVAAHYGEMAKNVRFSLQLPSPEAIAPEEIKLIFTLTNNEKVVLADFVKRQLDNDSCHTLIRNFFERINELPQGNILELGSRARSGISRRHLLKPHLNYVGIDILAGENVDVVGDAHQLSHHFAPQTFDAIFNISVFEHLIMPWKVAIEMNKVLKIGGFAMIGTHQTWGLHDTPWDFWRFSDQAWRGIFNRYTGFDIITAQLGEPAAIVPEQLHTATACLDRQPAYLCSSVIVKKIGETELNWNVDANEIVADMYPV